ncbi:MAG TPA: trehalose utilization [Bacteroidales bacterium]|nr:trehalose utilization [Bacteroidales bacterium]
MNKKYIFIILAALLIPLINGCNKKPANKALIITGQNNHDWKLSSPVLGQILEETGLFSVDIMTTPQQGGDMIKFNPDFSRYKLVVLDYVGDPWSEKTNSEFVDYVKNGGGVVVYHASCMAFPDWKEYNEMTGLGGWMNRNEKDGPYVYYVGNQLIFDTTRGPAGSHGDAHEFEVRTRNTGHPVTKGLPVRWMHGTDELYQQLRGPAKNMQVLATAFADTSFKGTGRNEPVLLALEYGKGRIFNTLLGHAGEGGGPAMQCTGFIVTLQRGAEWAATGAVTQIIPADFPTAAAVVLRPGIREITTCEAFEMITDYDIQKSTRYYTQIQAAISDAAGDEKKLSGLEKKMVKVLKNNKATAEAKKLMLRELSWMGSDYCIKPIKELVNVPELKDEAEFALERLGK